MSLAPPPVCAQLPFAICLTDHEDYLSAATWFQLNELRCRQHAMGLPSRRHIGTAAAVKHDRQTDGAAAGIGGPTKYENDADRLGETQEKHGTLSLDQP